MSTTNQIRDVLTKARDMLARPGGWIQRYNAIDRTGTPVGPTYGGAVAHCSAGAVYAVTGDPNGSDLADDALEALSACIGPEWRGLTYWNDASGRTQRDVLDLYDHAIERV